MITVGNDRKANADWYIVDIFSVWNNEANPGKN